MKKLFRLAFVIATAFLIVCVNVTPTYADSAEPPKEGDSSTEVTEDTSSKTKTKALTPDGNLTLVDDIKTKDTNEKEFLTVVSKSGNYFYIIVDRADNGEMNVHFLNLVDEKDLMDLIDEETMEPVKEPEPIIIEPTPEPEPEEEPKKSPIGAILAILGLLALAGGGAFYYFNFVKPNQSNGNPDNLDDLDWDDDDDEEEFDDNIEVERIEDTEEYPTFNTQGTSNVTTVEDQKTVDDVQDVLFGKDEE